MCPTCFHGVSVLHGYLMHRKTNVLFTYHNISKFTLDSRVQSFHGNPTKPFLCTNLLLQPHISILSPTRTPWVVHYPVLHFTLFTTVSDHRNSMVQRTSTFARSELEARSTCINTNRNRLFSNRLHEGFLVVCWYVFVATYFSNRLRFLLFVARALVFFRLMKSKASDTKPPLQPVSSPFPQSTISWTDKVYSLPVVILVIPSAVSTAGNVHAPASFILFKNRRKRNIIFIYTRMIPYRTFRPWFLLRLLSFSNQCSVEHTWCFRAGKRSLALILSRSDSYMTCKPTWIPHLLCQRIGLHSNLYGSPPALLTKSMYSTLALKIV